MLLPPFLPCRAHNCLVCGFQAKAEDMYHVGGDGVSGLFVSLGVRIHRQELVDLSFREPLQPEALPRHEAANPEVLGNNSLMAAGRNGVGNLTANAPPLLIAPGKTEVDGVSRRSLVVTALRRTLHIQDGVLRGVAIQTTVVPGGQSVGGIDSFGDPGLAVETDSIQPGLAADAASLRQQRFGHASRIIDPRILPSVYEQLKSFRICFSER